MSTTAVCYRIFGLDESATLNEIKAAYRRLAKRYHPDIIDNRGLVFIDASEKIKQINNAYDYLKRKHVKTKQEKCSGWLGFNIIMGHLKEKSCPLVSSVAECSPAILAGLQLGDYIVGFNGKNTLGIEREEIVNLFSGGPGIPVKIKIYRKSKNSIRTLYAIRLRRPSR
ncbi:MAG: DnaJ domain-containing protein [Pseudomonadota bacterium]